MVLSGSDAGVGASGRAARDLPRAVHNPAVVGVTLLGWGVTLVWEAPFCIAQGMVSLPYLYIGYLAKKRRLFETPFPAEPEPDLSCPRWASSRAFC